MESLKLFMLFHSLELYKVIVKSSENNSKSLCNFDVLAFPLIFLFIFPELVIMLPDLSALYIGLPLEIFKSGYL